MTTATASPNLAGLRDAWLQHWPAALAVWSKFTKLSEPRWCLDAGDEKKQGLADSFAMIRLTDQAVVVSLPRVRAAGVERFAREILAHEIGHHVYCPASLLDQGRMLARMRRGLPTQEKVAPLVANLYADLLINDRLQRDAGYDMAAVYLALDGDGSTNRLWTLYMRIYEILWSLPRNTLAPKLDALPRTDDVSAGKRRGPKMLLAVITADRLEGDAQLGARLIRSYARDWLNGAGKFAALCLPYVIEDAGGEVRRLLRGWLDTEHCGH